MARIQFARKTCSESLWQAAARKLEQLDSGSALAELKIPPANRAGQHRFRRNDQYRIYFMWTDKGPNLVEICDYR